MFSNQLGFDIESKWMSLLCNCLGVLGTWNQLWSYISQSRLNVASLRWASRVYGVESNYYVVRVVQGLQFVSMWWNDKLLGNRPRERKIEWETMANNGMLRKGLDLCSGWESCHKCNGLRIISIKVIQMSDYGMWNPN